MEISLEDTAVGEEDCTGAAAKCCDVEHVTDEVERVIGDSKAKMG
jgi:hypothetical protein